jgi:uncharacterized protein YbjT (DUF2867 family)
LTGRRRRSPSCGSAYFVETWGEVAQTVIADSVLPTFIEPSQKIPMVSTIDVGRAAAALLCEDWTGKRVVELSGPEDWSAGDVASAFAGVLGRPVAPLPVAPEQRAGLLAEEGVPAEVASALLGMYEGIANGLFTRESVSEQRRGTVSLATAIERVVATVEPAGR